VFVKKPVKDVCYPENGTGIIYDFLLVLAKKEVRFFETFVLLQCSHFTFGFPSTSLIVR